MTSVDSSGYSDRGVQVVLEALRKASSQRSDDSTQELIFGEVATLALDIHAHCRTPKLDILVGISCDAAYAGIYYAERTLQQKEAEADPQLFEETKAKLDRLAAILKEILALRNRITSRDCLSAAFIWCFGFWETKRVQRLRESLRLMIIHDFWPQGWERPSIRRTIEEVNRAKRFQPANAQ